MNSERHRRLLRVRAIAGRLAEREFRLAEGEARRLDALHARLDDLLLTLPPPLGGIDIVALHARTELGGRLEAAQRALAVPKDEARLNVGRKQEALLAATLAERRVERLVEKGEAATKRELERKAEAQSIFRRRR